MATAAQLIDAAAVLENSGEEALGEVTHLVLRNGKYDGFAPGVAEELSQLESVSLSGNAFTSLAAFHHFSNLRELNLNFNGIGGLASAGPAALPALPSLRKLFLSSNKLTNACLGPLPRRTPNLQTLCLYRNKIKDLEAACHVLKALPHLEELDLGGNPCSVTHAGYKHVLLHLLPGLRMVDSEGVRELDRQLAQEYMHKQQQLGGGGGGGCGSRRGSPRARVQGAPLARPSTAPVGRRGRVGGPGMSPRGAGAGQQPSPPVALFKSQFLNSNPILLQYLAQTSVQSPVEWGPLHDGDDDEEEEDAADEGDGEGRGGRGKARCQTDGGVGGGAGAAGDDTGILRRALAAREEQDSVAAQSNISQHSQTVHKLLQTIEHLRLALAESNTRGGTGGGHGASSGSDDNDDDGDNDGDRRAGVDAPRPGTWRSRRRREGGSARAASSCGKGVDELVRENQALQAENANLYCIQAENADLKKEVAALKERNARLEMLASSKYTLQLEQELQHLKGENANLKEHISIVQFDFELQRPRTSAEVLNDCEEEIDAEVSELIRRNGEELRQLRQTLKATKREMNLQRDHDNTSAGGNGGGGGGGGFGGGSSRSKHKHRSGGDEASRAGGGGGAVNSDAMPFPAAVARAHQAQAGPLSKSRPGAALRGKLKPIIDVVAKRKHKKRDKHAAAFQQAPRQARSGSGSPRSSDNGRQRSPPFNSDHSTARAHHDFATMERPTTANLLQRDISNDADVSEALMRLEEAQVRLQQMRTQSTAMGNTAQKYSGSGGGGGADVLVIRHDEDDDDSDDDD